MALAVRLTESVENGVPVWYLHYSYPTRLPGEPGHGPYHSRQEAEEALHRLKECAHSYGEYEFSSSSYSVG
ncbi:hypothetical protein ACPEEZ_03490 [Frigoribacterium sp. 2-23]|uniref:hypothetical protein n=1 Tax=Frigoribacterium sp. 2-23 TaxID=3415006 RepID=UPI003C6EAB5D